MKEGGRLFTFGPICFVELIITLCLRGAPRACFGVDYYFVLTGCFVAINGLVAWPVSP